MLKLKLTIFSLTVLLFSGCSGSVSGYLDVLLVNSNDESILNYDDTIPTSTHAQKELFEGNSYSLSSEFSTSVGVPVYFMGCVQDTLIHFENFNINTEGTPFKIYFYENPVVTNNGTQITGINLDRNSTNTHSLLLYANPTISTNGSLLITASDYGKNNIAGVTSIPNEMILNVNTCYLFEILNQDGATADVTSNFLWHEQ